MARSNQYPPSVKPGIPTRPSLPNGWRFVALGDLVHVVKRPATLDDSAEYQLVTAKRSRGGIVPRERLKGSEIKTQTQFFCEADDFLISRRQIIHGACGVVPASLAGAVVSNEYATLRVNGRLALPFLEALSHTTYFQQTCFQSSIGVDVEKMIFKLEDWLRYEVPLPPLPEQKKIAAILSAVDEAIQATEAVIAQTRRVKEGLLQDLLTRGIGHTRFKQTEIGEIPEEWEVRRLGRLAEFVTSGSRGWGQYYAKEGALFVRITNLTRESISIDLTDAKYVALPSGTAEAKRTRLVDGDILVSITADLGIIGLVGPGLGEAYVNQHIALVRLAGRRMLPALLRTIWHPSKGKSSLDSSMTAGPRQV